MLLAVVLLGLVLLAGTLSRTGRAGAWALVGVSLLWLAVNGPAEGPVLVTVTASRGLTVADMASLGGLVSACLALRADRPAARP